MLVPRVTPGRPGSSLPRSKRTGTLSVLNVLPVRRLRSPIASGRPSTVSFVNAVTGQVARRTPVKAVHAAFTEWAAATGSGSLSKHALTVKLQQRGFEPGKTGSVRLYKNLRLRGEWAISVPQVDTERMASVSDIRQHRSPALKHALAHMRQLEVTARRLWPDRDDPLVLSELVTVLSEYAAAREYVRGVEDGISEAGAQGAGVIAAHRPQMETRNDVQIQDFRSREAA